MIKLLLLATALFNQVEIFPLKTVQVAERGFELLAAGFPVDHLHDLLELDLDLFFDGRRLVLLLLLVFLDLPLEVWRVNDLKFPRDRHIKIQLLRRDGAEEWTSAGLDILPLLLGLFGDCVEHLFNQYLPIFLAQSLNIGLKLSVELRRKLYQLLARCALRVLVFLRPANDEQLLAKLAAMFFSLVQVFLRHPQPLVEGLFVLGVVFNEHEDDTYF